MGYPRDVRKQRLKEVLVPLDIRCRNFHGQGDCSSAFQTQRDQSLPSAAYRRPIAGTRSDGLMPVSANMAQGNDWPGISAGDKSGAQCDDFRRETINWPYGVPQRVCFVQNIFDLFLQSVDL